MDFRQITDWGGIDLDTRSMETPCLESTFFWPVFKQFQNHALLYTSLILRDEGVPYRCSTTLCCLRILPLLSAVCIAQWEWLSAGYGKTKPTQERFSLFLMPAAMWVQEFYDDDGQTAYVFTADHGMSNKGSHGDGDPANTETPIIVWGAGVANGEILHTIQGMSHS